jgi:hypothetical protein
MIFCASKHQWARLHESRLHGVRRKGFGPLVVTGAPHESDVQLSVCVHGAAIGGPNGQRAAEIASMDGAALHGALK